MRSEHFVLAAGGTGGHLYPAINTAIELRKLRPKARITIVGTERGLDREIVPASGFDLTLIPSVPFPRGLTRQSVSFPFALARSWRVARQFLQESQVSVVIGFGGYASAPAYLAARSLGIAFIVHEANSTAGLANKLGARFTQNIALNYSDTIAGGRVIGMPLSPGIATLDRDEFRQNARTFFDLPPTGPVVLVFGGSQGAQSINRAFQNSIRQLLSEGISVLHAVGARNDVPEPSHLNSAHYRPVAYITQMHLAYCAADLSVSRSGAMTVAEIGAVGLPAIFVPLEVGNGEQQRNAATAVTAGAALVVSNAEFTPEWIIREIPRLVKDREKLNAMSEAAHGSTRRNAAVELAEWALTLAQSGRNT